MTQSNSGKKLLGLKKKKITIYIARFGTQLTTILKNNTDESLMSTILFPSDVNVSLFSRSEL